MPPRSLGGVNTTNCTFGTAILFSPGEYDARSTEAHLVLGVGVLLMVVVWTSHVLQSMSSTECCLRSLTFRRALVASGAVQCGMGLYLLVWLCTLTLPYAARDLLQLQHAAIACLQLAAGLADALVGARLLPQGDPLRVCPSGLHYRTPTIYVLDFLIYVSGK